MALIRGRDLDVWLVRMINATPTKSRVPMKTSVMDTTPSIRIARSEDSQITGLKMVIEAPRYPRRARFQGQTSNSTFRPLRGYRRKGSMIETTISQRISRLSRIHRISYMRIPSRVWVTTSKRSTSTTASTSTWRRRFAFKDYKAKRSKKRCPPIMPRRHLFWACSQRSKAPKLDAWASRRRSWSSPRRTASRSGGTPRSRKRTRVPSPRRSSNLSRWGRSSRLRASTRSHKISYWASTTRSPRSRRQRLYNSRE